MQCARRRSGRGRRQGRARPSINLTGLLYQRGAQSFEALHVEAAANIAKAARDAGASTLVHVSAIGADTDSRARYAATKGEGEARVREAFPDAAILRPSLRVRAGGRVLQPIRLARARCCPRCR